jgi:hypothetical protein
MLDPALCIMCQGKFSLPFTGKSGSRNWASDYKLIIIVRAFSIVGLSLPCSYQRIKLPNVTDTSSAAEKSFALLLCPHWPALADPSDVTLLSFRT